MLKNKSGFNSNYFNSHKTGKHMISLTEQQRLVQTVVIAFPMREDMDVIILNRIRGEDVHNVEPIGVMFAKELLELVVVPFKDPHFVEQEMDKIVVAFLVKVVRLGHLVRNVIEMDVVLIVLEDKIFLKSCGVS